MNGLLDVTICQTDIKWNDPKANIRAVESLLGNISTQHDHLVVLPEMWSTGFIMNPQATATTMKKSTTLKWMKEFAFSRHCALCGSIPMKIVAGSYHNRLLFVMPSGETHYYDKHHLFTPGGEAKAYEPGNSIRIVEYCGFRFLLMICYDLRFPVWSRYGRRGEYDAIIYVANWPASRHEGWDVLTRARAIENQCYVIAANRVGADPVTSYKGWSRIVGPRGEVVKECPLGEVSTITCTLDIGEIGRCRTRFPALRDRD